MTNSRTPQLAGGAERRLWAFMLALLVCSRLAAAACNSSLDMHLPQLVTQHQAGLSEGAPT